VDTRNKSGHEELGVRDCHMFRISEALYSRYHHREAGAVAGPSYPDAPAALADDALDLP
jgi:hypothetical protein